jgi:DNA-binding XRE family transcriptional regulator
MSFKRKKNEVGFLNLKNNIAIYLRAYPNESIPKIAKIAGISTTTLYGFMESGKCLNGKTITKLCEYFGLDICELFSSQSNFIEKFMNNKKAKEKS